MGSSSKWNPPLQLVAGAVSTLVALALIGLKLWGALKTHSMTVWVLMLDSLLDLSASLINLTFIYRAVQPPNEQYPYGYGKGESIAALTQSYLMIASACYLAVESILSIIKRKALASPDVGLWVLGVSWGATLCLTLFLRFVYHRTGSVAIRADSFHYETDLLTNFAGMISLGIVRATGFALMDKLFSLTIVLYIVWGAYNIAYRSIQELLDKALTPDERRRIQGIIKTFSEMLHSPHDFRSRRSGSRVFIEFHIEAGKNLSLEAAHELVEDLIERIKSEFPSAEVTVHIDPTGATR